MKTKFVLGLLPAFSLLLSCERDQTFFPEPDQIEWNTVIGGQLTEYARGAAKTQDGGYLVAGWTLSQNTGDITGSKGKEDAVITKVDANGNKQWTKAYGGSDKDEAYAIAAAGDGDFIVTGYSGSNDGDVTATNMQDFWIFKIDVNGTIKWSKTYGSSNNDQAKAIAILPDGGCIVTGWTEGNDRDVTGNHSNMRDFWILKLDASGNKQWAKTYGGTSTEEANSIVSCPDGGYAIAGWNGSSDGDVTGHHGAQYLDVWVLKIDANGNKVWDNSFGGSSGDEGYSIKNTPDGGFIVAGEASSKDGDVTGLHADFFDAWLIKLDGNGKKQWAKTYGGTGSECAYSVTVSPDGGYVFGGRATSDDGDVSGHRRPGNSNTGSGADCWLAKLNSDGLLLWNKCYGSNGNDEALSLFSTNDNHYLLSGYVQYADKDVTGAFNGEYDMWLLKVKLQ